MSFNPTDRSPTLVKLLRKRLAPIREKELIAKALCADRPEKPKLGACCGSSCDPCVMDMYAEELKVWKECWVKWDGEEEVSKDGSVVKEEVIQEVREKERKMPGAFEW